MKSIFHTHKLMNDMFKTMHGKQLEKQVISLRRICAETITSRYQTMTYMCCKGRTMFLPISNQGVNARPSNSIKIRNFLQIDANCGILLQHKQLLHRIPQNIMYNRLISCIKITYLLHIIYACKTETVHVYLSLTYQSQKLSHGRSRVSRKSMLH